MNATECTNCGKQFAVRPEMFGRRAKCKACGETFVIAPPAPPPEPEPAYDYDATDGSQYAEGANPFDDPSAAESPWGDSGSYSTASVAPPPTPAPAAPAYTAYSPSARSTSGSSGGSGRPAWLNLKSIGGGALTLVMIVLFVILRSSRVRHEIQRNLGDPQQRQQRQAADLLTLRPPPGGSTLPEFAWSKDADGHAVGNAHASVKSTSTSLRLVLPAGNHAAKSLPCVFVCPAGSNLVCGVPFGDDEREDFYGLLDKGIAVCFFTLDGTIDDLESVNELQLIRAMQVYLGSNGGLGNLQDAIDTVLAGAPSIDPTRLGAMGHSSAGTVALTGARWDRRITAVAAMAPAIDVPERLSEVMPELPEEFQDAIRKLSPSLIDRLNADVFIYACEDDDNTPASEARAFASKHGPKVSLSRGRSGGHVGAYLQGMTPGIEFLARKLRATPPAGSSARG